MGKKKNKVDLMKTDIPAVIEEVKKSDHKLKEPAIQILELAERIKQLIIEEQNDSKKED